MRRPKKELIAVLVGAGAVVALAAGPVYAVTPTGNEKITSPIAPYSVPVTASNTPDDSQIVVSGTGWAPSSNVFAIVCDGKSPSAPGWSLGTDCDNLTAPAQQGVGSNGTFTFNGGSANFRIGVVRGQSPNDQFNCLAPADDPTGIKTADNSNQPIDNTVPSWGSSKALSSAGGGTAGCQIRIAYSNTSTSSSDQYLALAIQSSPPQSAPEAPLPILLPLAGILTVGATGEVTRRRRRARTAA